MQDREIMESTTSYALGCGSVFLGWICDAAELWQALALFLGVLVIVIRILHDSLRLYRAFFKREKI